MEWSTYATYHGRWQLSTIVMSVPITVFTTYLPAWQALALSQFIGACVFWYIDKWIFEDQTSEPKG
jgi:hypothetical protein